MSLRASLVAQMVKNLPAMRETLVQYLSREDPLEKGVATHSSIFAWRIPFSRGAWRATVPRVPKSLTGLSSTSLWSFMGAFQVALVVKNPPTMQKTQFQSPGWEDPLEKGTATHSSIFAWRIPGTEEPDRLPSMGSQRVRHS